MVLTIITEIYRHEIPLILCDALFRFSMSILILISDGMEDGNLPCTVYSTADVPTNNHHHLMEFVHGMWCRYTCILDMAEKLPPSVLCVMQLFSYVKIPTSGNGILICKR